MNKDLSEDSLSYQNEAHIYQLFSDSEDFPDKVFQSLSPEFQNKTVLDLGCGNGKYAHKISNIASEVYAVDKSEQQLSLIPTRYNIYPSQADAFSLPYADNRFDVVFSSWMLGTIIDEDKRLLVLNEAKRVLKIGGKLILVENDIGSEFEQLRGRYPHIEKTHHYNNWLLQHGLSISHQLFTYFKFKDVAEASQVFLSIWGDKLTRKITSRIIEHRIAIFTYRK